VNADACEMSFHTITRAVRGKQMDHQGTSHTVVFAWQCVEMDLEGWRLQPRLCPIIWLPLYDLS